MGFKENLKAELQFQNITVKELAVLSGVKKQTLDNYLSTHNSIPAADAAVKIAQALRVSVEYLVTGKESGISPERDSRLLALESMFKECDDHNRQLLFDIAQAVRKNS